jgi:hypothetical protein
MKLLTIFLSLFFISISSFAQTPDPKVSVAGHSDGSVTKAELVSQEKLIPGSNDIIIISFTMSYPIGEDDFVELASNSDKLTSEMKENIKKVKVGTDITFENIKAKRGDKTLILEAIIIKIKE